MSSDHSFKKLSEKNGVIFYYTNPTKTHLSGDMAEILAFYEKALSEASNKKWVWIFDSQDFTLKYALESKTGSGFAKLITEKYGHNLQEIKIINPTWQIRSILTVVWPFLNKATKDKVKIMGDRYYSVVEFV